MFLFFDLLLVPVPRPGHTWRPLFLLIVIFTEYLHMQENTKENAVPHQWQTCALKGR